MGNKVISYIILLLFIFTNTFVLWVGSFNFSIWAVIPNCCGSGSEDDHMRTLEISFFLSVFFSCVLAYFIKKSNKKVFFILYVLFFILLLLLHLYILRNRM